MFWFFRPNIAKLTGRKDMRGLVKAQRFAHDPTLRAKAAESLEQLGWKADNPDDAAFHLLAKKDWAALATMGQSALRPAIAALEFGLEGEDDLVTLLINMGRLATDSLVPELSGLNRRAQAKAERILIGIGAPAVSAIIRRVNKGKADSLRFMAAMERMGDKAVEPLVCALEQGGGKGRLVAVLVLAKIGQPAIAPLGRVTASRDPVVRLAAVSALARMYAFYGIGAAAGALQVAKDDNDERIRRLAGEALA